MVAVCDNLGRQIPPLQGRCSERKQTLAYLITKYPKIKLHGKISFEKKQWEIDQQDVSEFMLPMLIRQLTKGDNGSMKFNFPCKDNIIHWCKACQIEAVYNKESWLWYCPKCKDWGCVIG